MNIKHSRTLNKTDLQGPGIAGAGKTRQPALRQQGEDFYAKGLRNYFIKNSPEVWGRGGDQEHWTRGTGYRGSALSCSVTSVKTLLFSRPEP